MMARTSARVTSCGGAVGACAKLAPLKRHPIPRTTIADRRGNPRIASSLNALFSVVALAASIARSHPRRSPRAAQHDRQETARSDRQVGDDEKAGQDAGIDHEAMGAFAAIGMAPRLDHGGFELGGR